MKESTGIAGVPVVPRAREILMRAYEKYLTELEQFEQGALVFSHKRLLLTGFRHPVQRAHGEDD